jgi:hypothetical protein
VPCGAGVCSWIGTASVAAGAEVRQRRMASSSGCGRAGGSYSSSGRRVHVSVMISTVARLPGAVRGF